MSFISISNGHQAPDKNNPGTHIFIVGVGEYPELNNSGNRFYTDFSGQLSARLTSAVQSAVHMANWFIAHYSNPAAPLRSVEMLLSPTQTYVTPGANPTSHQVDEANIANIEQTFIDWHDRCDARDDNIAVFYFAGHGLYCTTQLLLAQDFLVNQATPLVAAIDYDQTFHEMARCQAKHQFFFIDACRYDNQAINGAGSGPNMQVSKATTLSKSPIIRPMQSRNALQLFATQINCSALGNANQPSRFAAALGEHLTGRGATKNRQGDWLVSHQHLGPYLRRSMDRDNQLLYPQQSGQHQTPDPVIHCPLGESTLHNLTGAPQIPARLGCDPRSANQDADFTLKEIQTGSVISHDSPGSHGGEPWSLNLMANDYTFETVFPNGSFQNKACTVRAETPFTDFNVEVN